MSLFLSRLCLAMHRRDVRADLADCCRLHTRLLQAFAAVLDGAPARAAHGVLYRIEDRARGLLLVQSQSEPDWLQLPVGYLSAQVKPLALAVVPGQQVVFRLLGNPVKSAADPAARGHRTALSSSEELQVWFQRQAEAAGLQVDGVMIQAEPVLQGWHRTERRVVLAAVRYDGVATVNDVTRLTHAMEHGIGHGKAYGCGLLSIAGVA